MGCETAVREAFSFMLMECVSLYIILFFLHIIIKYHGYKQCYTSPSHFLVIIFQIIEVFHVEYRAVGIPINPNGDSNSSTRSDR